ncbi:MAG TPA: hypothetical protein VN898_15585 [Candidatus Binatia bacterium]|jgi:uncharacterized membrane protein|nr:hypothetical protein [Candidatus Binatia bacterium]
MSLDPIAAEEAQVSPEDLNEEDKVMLIFSYLWVLALVPFMATRREYVRWHAKQGLILCGIACLVFLGVIFVGAILATLSRVFAWVFAFALINLVLLYLAVAIVCVIKAIRGERWAIPFLGDLVEKI